ncbi:glutathione S-transferase family protein [Methylobrevis pamukkalensis]|uniref:Putative GST-like protein YibF n=1 Tax=Methylobrevis pamukkalensis TaxID=1439726 RepID=A0A1E3H564_9HYPH|nr:glutathione S-transferase family protein [Methylobrevis pamukkalensis]ODN71469.1 putative GST-like protein YibF [Methylobrevis pamukkalensis]
MTDADLLLRGSPASPFVRKARIAAAVLGLGPRLRLVETDTATPGPDLLADNPLGKIPVLVGPSGKPVYDSRVIVEYLDHLAGGGLFPADAEARFDDLVLQATADGLADAALLIVYETRFRADGERSETWVARQMAKITRTLAMLEATRAPFAAPVTAGAVALACALGYLDLRFAGDWRAERPRLVGWLEDFSAAVPAFAATRPAG